MASSVRQGRVERLPEQANIYMRRAGVRRRYGLRTLPAVSSTVTYPAAASSRSEAVAPLRKVRQPLRFLRPSAEYHPGIGQGRITKNLGTFVEKISGSLNIPDEKSLAMLYELLDTTGLYLGASSSLNVVAAVEMAQKLGPG
jgi:cysteine synthase